jgi:hypothetical protein
MPQRLLFISPSSAGASELERTVPKAPVYLASSPRWKAVPVVLIIGCGALAVSHLVISHRGLEEEPGQGIGVEGSEGLLVKR